MTVPRFDIADIRDYYDRHTPAFIRFGQGGRAGGIHRAVWGPGVTTREAAFHFVEDRVAELAQSLAAAPAVSHLVDLGCGVGTSLCYLATRLPIRGTGITVSPLQARLAAQRFRAACLSDRLTCIEGDFCEIPPRVERADLAYAIESFVHVAAPHSFLAACARLVRPGGLLVVCDDFRRSADNDTGLGAIERFRRGWRINTLLSQDELCGLAEASGFERLCALDLTPALEIRRARDRALRVLSAVASCVPFGANRLDYVLGGSALQECLVRGWIGYDFTVFRRLRD